MSTGPNIAHRQVPGCQDGTIPTIVKKENNYRKNKYRCNRQQRLTLTQFLAASPHQSKTSADQATVHRTEQAASPADCDGG